MGKSVNKIVIIVAVVMIIVNTFFVQLCRVTGSSMEPTYRSGEVLLINKITNKFERMDIVVVKNNGKLLIKRIVGLPGETIEIKENKIFINDKEIEDVVNVETEPGIASNKITLGNDGYFILGDNRTNSKDSRDESVGVVNQSEIVGKVFSIIPKGE